MVAVEELLSEAEFKVCQPVTGGRLGYVCRLGRRGQAAPLRAKNDKANGYQIESRQVHGDADPRGVMNMNLVH